MAVVSLQKRPLHPTPETLLLSLLFLLSWCFPVTQKKYWALMSHKTPPPKPQSLPHPPIASPPRGAASPKFQSLPHPPAASPPRASQTPASPKPQSLPHPPAASPPPSVLPVGIRPTSHKRSSSKPPPPQITTSKSFESSSSFESLLVSPRRSTSSGSRPPIPTFTNDSLQEQTLDLEEETQIIGVPSPRSPRSPRRIGQPSPGRQRPPSPKKSPASSRRVAAPPSPSRQRPPSPKKSPAGSRRVAPPSPSRQRPPSPKKFPGPLSPARKIAGSGSVLLPPIRKTSEPPIPNKKFSTPSRKISVPPQPNPNISRPPPTPLPPPITDIPETNATTATSPSTPPLPPPIPAVPRNTSPVDWNELLRNPSFEDGEVGKKKKKKEKKKTSKQDLQDEIEKMKRMMVENLGPEVQTSNLMPYLPPQPKPKAKPQKRKKSLNSEIAQMKELMMENLGEDIQQTNMIPSTMMKQKKKPQKSTKDREAEYIKEFESRRKKFLKERGGKGIFFGETLEDSYHLSEELQVPHLVEECIEFLMIYGLEEEGILRLSTGEIERQALKKEFDEGHRVQLASQDIHCVACVLKEYFRELSVPIIPFDFYESFVDLYSLVKEIKEEDGEKEDGEVKEETEEENTKKLFDPQILKAKVSLLPDLNQKVLGKLILMLHTVSTHSEVNKMTPNNLAIVFGQNLLRSESPDLMKVMADSPAVQAVCKFLIAFATEIFPENQPPEEPPSSEN